MQTLKALSLTLLFFFSLHISVSYSQVKDIGINFTRKGFIQEINPKLKVAVINYVDATAISEELLKLSATNLVINGDNGVNNINSLRVGMDITVEGELFQSGNYGLAHKITVTPIDKQLKKITLGRIDGIKNTTCYIDGNVIQMQPGKTIAGANGYKGHTFDGFTSLKLGDIANAEGNYDYNGYFSADGMNVEPDVETDLDKQAKEPITKLHALMYEKWIDPQQRSAFFGQELFQGIHILPSKVLQEYVNSVGLKLIPEHTKEKIKFMFVVVDDERFNAYVFPNGFAVVNIGLFRYVQNEAQLAAVLGHEIAHAIYEHGAKKIADMEKAAKRKGRFEKLSKVFKNVNDQLNPTLNVKYGNITESKKIDNSFFDLALKDLPASYIDKLTTQYTVEEESQADRVGLYLMVQAGYDPREAPKIWKQVYNESPKYKAEEKKEGENTSTTNKSNNGLLTITGSIINNSVKKGIANNKSKSINDHPEDIVRFGDLNRLIALYWSDKKILDNADNGELVFLGTFKKVMQELNALSEESKTKN